MVWIQIITLCCLATALLTIRLNRWHDALNTVHSYGRPH